MIEPTTAIYHITIVTTLKATTNNQITQAVTLKGVLAIACYTQPMHQFLECLLVKWALVSHPGKWHRQRPVALLQRSRIERTVRSNYHCWLSPLSSSKTPFWGFNVERYCGGKAITTIKASPSIELRRVFETSHDGSHSQQEVAATHTVPCQGFIVHQFTLPT